jgi:hypothetical protein
MSEVEVTVEARRYTVCAVPEGNVNRYHFEIHVEWRAPESWAVVRQAFCLGTDGDWEYESIPSERAEEWKATHRFPLERALELAKAAAPHVTVNGWTVAQTIAAGERRA